MKSYHLVVLVMAVGLAIGILYLVRRDHIYIRQGVFWIGIALFSLLLGLWPALIDQVGTLLGDIALTKLKRDLRRLNQRIALLEADHPEKEGAAPPK